MECEGEREIRRTTKPPSLSLDQHHSEKNPNAEMVLLAVYQCSICDSKKNASCQYFRLIRQMHTHLMSSIMYGEVG